MVFVVINLPNKCDINFYGKNFPDVPVFITIFISFVAGLICALPLALLKRKPKKEPAAKDKKPAKEELDMVSRSGSPDGGPHVD
jgi:uncharacterized integral membrane protein